MHRNPNPEITINLPSRAEIQDVVIDLQAHRIARETAALYAAAQIVFDVEAFRAVKMQTAMEIYLRDYAEGYCAYCGDKHRFTNLTRCHAECFATYCEKCFVRKFGGTVTKGVPAVQPRREA